MRKKKKKIVVVVVVIANIEFIKKTPATELDCPRYTFQQTTNIQLATPHSFSNSLTTLYS